MEFLCLFCRDLTIKDVANHGTYSNPGTQVGPQNKNRVRTGHRKPGMSWTVAELGEGLGYPGPPLFLDQTEAQRAEKIWGGDQPPHLISGSG